METLQDYKLNEKSLATINPANGEIITHVEMPSQEEIDRLIKQATNAYQQWSHMSMKERADCLFQAARILKSKKNEIAKLETLDTGKPINETMNIDLPSAIESIEFFAGAIQTYYGQQQACHNGSFYTRHEPLGVCLGIGAWNYPLQIACWKSAPALACGNAMLFKPSELTPLTAKKLEEIYIEAGIPQSIFTVVQGAGNIGSYLCEHPDIAKISLTGAVSTGKKVMTSAAKTLKPVTLELGGKSPLIIFEDCQIENAVEGALMANFYCQGEVCSNGTRVFVHESIQDAFTEKLRQRTAQLSIGTPLNPATQVGALISAQHMDKVLSYIAIGKREGANLLLGGNRVMTPECCKGYFVEPTIFTNCHDDMQIVKEEIFGPVLSILTFKDENEVIRRANNTFYGLSAGIFTENIRRAHRVVERLQAGTCWINTYNITPLAMPFGGYKLSGLGRENGMQVLSHYTQQKSVYIEYGDIRFE